MLLVEWPVLSKMIDDVEPHLEECCGFFFGQEKDNTRTITKAIPVVNSKAGSKRTNYEITATNYMYAELVAYQQGLTLLGVYHSHLNKPAIPSEYDRLAAQPYFSYIIISIENKKLVEVRSWQLDPESQFEEVKLDLIPSSLKHNYGNSYYPNAFTKIYQQ
jgi:proteasome lid subunit RPN8/RPN11